MKPFGYDVQICFICWSNFGPREMADKTKPIIPPGAEELPYVEAPPNAVPDISATSEINLVDAWNGTGAYARDNSSAGTIASSRPYSNQTSSCLRQAKSRVLPNSLK